MARHLLLGLTALLITYGSLYPFDFSPAVPGALDRMFASWQLLSSRGDMVGNVVLFVPWGVAGVFSFGRRFGGAAAAAATAVIGFAIALGVQLGQVWLPSRHAALGDVFWNMLGLVVGVLLGRFLQQQAQFSGGRSRDSFPAAALLVAWVLLEWSPLVPSIDFQLLKDQLKQLTASPVFSISSILLRSAVALLFGSLLSVVFDRRSSLWILPLLLAGIVCGKLLFRSAPFDASVLLGFFLGACGWWATYRMSDDKRYVIIVFALLAAYTAEALSPFVLRDAPAPISWVPFEGLLRGSMMINLWALVSRLVLYASLLQVFRMAGARVSVASVGIAFWVLITELMQTVIEGRSGDLTEPLLVILLGQVFKSLQRRAPVDRQVGKHTPQPRLAGRASTMKPQWISLLVVVVVIGSGLKLLLRIPQLPYNVKELFRNDGSVLDLVFFALALLWTGAGSVWLARRLMCWRLPEVRLPVSAVAVSLVSLALLWAAVTTESIEDIAGSSNLFWFVTNKDIWGGWWREVFLRLDTPDLIEFVERCVRYSALYAPIPICLGLMIALREWLPGRSGGYSWLLRLTASALALLWLCKAIAFDWSSTDNLNELIARDGQWGWGGGGYLYGLLLLFCLNGMWLAQALTVAGVKRALIVLFTLAAMPLGWWLLNQGLEQRVEKYGMAFSGVQFLLGPDRSHLLSSEILFMRWSLVQFLGTVVLGAGLWLGNFFFMRGRAN